MHTVPADTSHQHLFIRTTCGRQISVGLLALGEIHHPAERISLDISPVPGTGDGAWAGLTAPEARKLAAALLFQAAAAEHPADNVHPTVAGLHPRNIPQGGI
jgi:hypothetical protein